MIWSQAEMHLPDPRGRAGRAAAAEAPSGCSVETPDGETLARRPHSAGDESERPKPLILGFGGNAWNGSDVAAFLHELYPDADVVAFHYRGYRPSTGTPSAEALLADAPLVYDAAVERSEARTRSSPSASASAAASPPALRGQRQLDGLILVTPFDSLKAVAQRPVSLAAGRPVLPA